MYKLSSASMGHIEGVDDELIAVAELAIQITTVDFGYGKFGGLRTVEDQQYLHETGASPNCDGVIKRSKHQDGLAIDPYAFVNGETSWKHDHLAMVILAHLQAANRLGVRIEAGALWKPKQPKLINGIVYGWDMPHIEKVTA